MEMVVIDVTALLGNPFYKEPTIWPTLMEMVVIDVTTLLGNPFCKEPTVWRILWETAWGKFSELL